MHPSEIVKDIDFDAVGSTNLKALDTTKKLLNEKLSVLIFADILKNYPKEAGTARQTPLLKMVSVPRGLNYTEYFHSTYSGGNPAFSVSKNEKEYIPQINLEGTCIDFEELLTPKHVDGFSRSFKFPSKVLSIHPGGKFKEISFFDATRKMDIPEDMRIDELLKHFKIDAGVFSPFKLESGLRPIQFPHEWKDALNDKVDLDSFSKFQNKLEDCFSSGFPRAFEVFNLERKFERQEYGYSYKNSGLTLWRYKGKKTEDRVYFPKPVFYEPLGPMTYDIHAHRALPQIFFYRLFLNPDGCGLREALIPCIYVLQERKAVGSNTEKLPESQDPCHVFMTGLPNMERLPLWNIDRIMSSSTDTVVLCGCIQDAEALQRANEDIENVAFTGYIGDHRDIDWLPLERKNIVFLISPHNGISLEDAYEETSNIHIYLTETIKLEIPEVAFVQRDVSFPGDTSTIATPETLASVYYHNRPKVDPESLIPPMNKSEFHMMLAKIQKKRMPIWEQQVESKLEKKNPADEILIRSLLHRNSITVLAGQQEIGKSRIVRSLIRYIVKGNDREFMKGAFWTRCCKKSDIKILYWNFDGVPDLDSWREICLEGMESKQRENVIIEDGPLWTEGFHNENTGKPLLDPYKKLLEDYANNRGTPGHPVDLLIVDTLSCVWKKEKIEDTLKFLTALIKAVPGMAVLAVHHTTDLGKPLGGGNALRIPRIVLNLEKVYRKDSSSTSTCKNVFKLTYDKFSVSHAEIENCPLYFCRENEDMFSICSPVCSYEEMLKSLIYYYKNIDDRHKDITYPIAGAILGYSGRALQDNMIEEESYIEILSKAKRNAKKNELAYVSELKLRKKKKDDCADDLGEEEDDLNEENDGDDVLK